MGSVAASSLGGRQHPLRHLSETKIKILSRPKSYLVTGGGLARLLDPVHEAIRRCLKGDEFILENGWEGKGRKVVDGAKSKTLRWAIVRSILSTCTGETGRDNSDLRDSPKPSRVRSLCP